MKHRVIIKKPNETAKVEYIDGSLEGLQRVVGGYIEYSYIEKLWEKGISVIVNEEGKCIDLTPSIALLKDGKMIDYYCGNVIFVGNKETEEGNSNESLSDEQIEFLKRNVFNGLKCITTKEDVLNVIQI